MNVPSSGSHHHGSATRFQHGTGRRSLVTPAEGDKWARRGSKLRRVFNLLADGDWHTGSEIHAAYNAGNPDPSTWGWEWQSCISQLRKKLRDTEKHGGATGDIASRQIEGRDEFEYQMTLPKQKQLKPHLDRTAADVQRRKEQLGLGV